MTKRTTIIKISLLLLGAPLLSGCTEIISFVIQDLSNKSEFVPPISNLEEDSKINSEAEQTNTADFYYYRGYEKDELGDYYGAISDYTKAIEINPRHPKVYNERGYSKNELKDYKGAILDFNKAIEINPRDYLAYYNRARSKAFLGDSYGSISDNSRAIEINPNLMAAYKNRGIDKEKIGDIKGACADWRKASSLGDKDSEKWLYQDCY